jgi:murein DD-endopeptidase MepM/ murein hydrolase activator NlpD
MNEFKVGITSKSSLQNTLAQKAEALARGDAAKEVMERKRAAQEFVSFLYLEVLKAMRATLPKDGLFEGDSVSRDIYSAMFDTEVARVMARRDSEGLTRTVERSIEKMLSMSRAEGLVSAPAEDSVSSSFGIRDDPVHGQNGFHGAMDIAAPAGAEITPDSSGKISFSSTASSYSKLVEVDYRSGMVTRYAHKASYLVAIGEQINAGQAIATAGRAGRAAVDFFPFELRQEEKPVDPARMIGSAAKGSKISSML